MVRLPPQVHVFVRDWLSSNNIVLKSNAGDVVIDSGYHVHAQHTLQLLRTRWGLGERPLSRLVNTHCHSDHIGGNAAIAAAYGCPISIPAGEAHLIDPWNPDGLWLDYADQFAPQFMYDALIETGDVNVWGDLEWQALAAPGHDMGALMFYNAAHRLLITGDALWEDGFGFVLPAEMDSRCIPAARATLDLIEALGAEVVIPGHGEPFTDVRGAVMRARSRLAALEQDPARNARHILKVMLVFSLLSGRRIRALDLADYCRSVPVFRDFNDRFLRQDVAELATLLVSELERAGAIRRDGEWLVPG
ncbi:MAG: MBL fold metallo-hydrolase [Casimicrobiaceae bacterium]